MNKLVLVSMLTAAAMFAQSTPAGQTDSSTTVKTKKHKKMKKTDTSSTTSPTPSK